MVLQILHIWRQWASKFACFVSIAFQTLHYDIDDFFEYCIMNSMFFPNITCYNNDSPNVTQCDINGSLKIKRYFSGSSDMAQIMIL